MLRRRRAINSPTQVAEVVKELEDALQVLQSRHLVLLASLRERAVDHAASRPVESFPQALGFLAADRYFAERREVLANLAALGIPTLDTTAQHLAVALANRYLDIKASGRL